MTPSELFLINWCQNVKWGKWCSINECVPCKLSTLCGQEGTFLNTFLGKIAIPQIRSLSGYVTNNQLQMYPRHRPSWFDPERKWYKRGFRSTSCRQRCLQFPEKGNSSELGKHPQALPGMVLWRGPEMRAGEGDLWSLSSTKGNVQKGTHVSCPHQHSQ